jgi:hypothetical protein
MPVRSVTPEPAAALLLAGLDFADAYQLVVGETALDAMAAAQRVFSRMPGWIVNLLALRNRLGALIGLNGGGEAAFDKSLPPEKRRRIGLFPIVSETRERVVMGFDDWHLDFRVVVDVLSLEADRQQVTTTTLVRTHNWVGRAYLALIMPFHRAIARSLLAQAAKA